MRFKLAFVIFLLSLGAQAAHVTVSITLTNPPLTGNSFTRNGTLVEWTNAPLNSTTFISTNASIPGAGTNLARHLAANMPAWYVRQTNATNITISGTDAQFSIGAVRYAILVTNSTTSTSNTYFPRLPFGYTGFATNETNQANDLLSGMRTYGSDLWWLLTLSNKVHKGAFLNGGTLSNTVAHLVSGQLINVGMSNVTVTNLNSPGSAGGSQVIGDGASAQGTNSVAFGVGAGANDYGNVAIGNAALADANGPYSIAIGHNALTEATAGNQVAIGYFSTANGTNAIALGALSSSPFGNSVALGANATSTAANQIRLGTSSEHVSIPGLLPDATLTNTLFRGTNTFNSEIKLTPRVNSTVISGYASAINLGTNAYVRVTGASAAITNASFTGGYAGLRVLVEFVNPGLSCVLLDHSSIGAPASTEQINNGTGALVNMTNNPAMFELIHNGTEWLTGWRSN